MAHGPALSPQPSRPNVLILMTDQHRGDLMTCAGSDLVPTPSIDRIAARGVRFTQAYCPYPVCVASRMSLLTGLYAHTHGAINNVDRLDWRFRTLAHHFADHGYLTALLGKMHFNDAHKHGFEYHLSINDWLMYLGPKALHYANEIANHPLSPNFFDTVDDDGAGLPDVSGLWRGQSPWVGRVSRRDFRSMASELEAEDHLDAFLARETVNFLRRHRNQPFLCVASFMKPHTPLYAPREWAARYPVESMKLPPVGDPSSYPPHIQNRIRHMQSLDPLLRKAHRAGYLANLAFVDECLGQVYDALKELGLVENTLVVYTSDHGEMNGDHGLFQKFCLFEPSVQVPLILSQPGRLPQGTVCDALTEYFGLYPTLADLAGLEPPTRTAQVPFEGAPDQLEATSFAPLTLNPTLPGPEAVFSEYNLRSPLCSYMVRTRRHKYIYNQGALDELYDHEADPGETHNLAGDSAYASVVSELRDRLFAWHDPASNPYRPPQ